MPSRWASCAVIGSPVISICRALPGRQQARQEHRRAAAGGEADHRLGLPEGGGLGGDDEVGALGELAAAAVGDPVDGGEDRLAQLPHRVQRAVEVLALAQPVLLGHVLALAQVAADGERSLAGSGEDDDADGGADGDRLDDLGQASAHLGRDRVVGVRPVERDRPRPGRRGGSRRARANRVPRHRRRAGRSRAPSSGRCLSAVVATSCSSPRVTSRAPPASASPAGSGRSSTRRRA